MAQKINLVVLPTANPEYDFQNELTMRRAIVRSFNEVSDDFRSVTTLSLIHISEPTRPY